MDKNEFGGATHPSDIPAVRASSRPDVDAPLVWLLLGERQGDNAQVRALGLALNWRCEVKHVYFDESCPVPFSKRGASLIGLDLARSSPLEAPWPDVVLAVGRRPAAISQWIKKQSEGRALSIHLGRARDAIENFDLILTTPQYALPPSPNVLELTFPITYLDEAVLEAAAREWTPRLCHLPRPWTALFVGGPTTQMRFDREVARDLLDKALTHIDGKGSLLVTTSPRTDADTCDLIERQIQLPHFMFRWSRTGANPYLAFLNLADSFIVTNDSPSMVADLVDRRRPVFLYEIPFKEKVETAGVAQFMRQQFRRRRQRRQSSGLTPDPIDRIYDYLMRHGMARPRRNASAFTQRLYGLEAARPLGSVAAPTDTGVNRHVTEEERNLVVARIKQIHAAKRRG